jgi:hypothetical protein
MSPGAVIEVFYDDNSPNRMRLTGRCGLRIE